jgi:hypothetical protein
MDSGAYFGSEVWVLSISLSTLTRFMFTPEAIVPFRNSSWW